MRWAVAHAEMAPSEHNAQPWRFLACLDRPDPYVDLLLDESRRLPVVDPDFREGVLACGAALLNLRLALDGARLLGPVELFPDADAPELLARVHLLSPPLPGTTEACPELRAAVFRRRTHRGPFAAGDVALDLQDHLVAEAGLEGGFVQVLAPQARRELATVTALAAAQLWTDGGFRREAASWARTNTSGQRDGVPGYAEGEGAVHSWVQPALTRAGRPVITSEDLVELIENSPLVLVLGSRDDSRPSLLRAGASMQRLLLRATAGGLAASYLNAGLHVPALRAAVARLSDVPAAQVALRLGYGDPVRATPRRGVSEVLDLGHQRLRT